MHALWLFYLPPLLLGLSLGSFVNAWVWRTRVGTPITRGWSACTKCHHRLAAADNIPLISYLFLKGKCKYCSRHISWQYPLVEFVTGFLFVLMAIEAEVHLFGITAELFTKWIILTLLVFIFVYDLKYKEIWDRATTIPAVILFAFGGVFGWLGWSDMIFGALIGGGFFYGQYLLSKGTWIGGGDVRMGIFMGVVLGWKLLLVALLIAYVLGAIVGIGLLLFGKAKRKTELPFGTFLAVGTLIAMCRGAQLIDWYLKLL